MLRTGAPARRGVRYVTRPGIYGVLPRGGRILLTRQAAPVPEVQLPGGGIDPGEPPLRALHREVEEETGWRIAAPRRLGAFRRFTWMSGRRIWAEKVCHVYLARPVARLGPPSEAGHDALWAAPSEAVGLLDDEGFRAAVATLV